MEEWEFPLKSMETKDDSSQAIIPFNCFFDACSKASLRFSVVVLLRSWATKSTIDTVGVGTRSEYPSNRPARSGITKDNALAAPVVVGMIFCPAARARRKSLWARSRMRWSLV